MRNTEKEDKDDVIILSSTSDTNNSGSKTNFVTEIKMVNPGVRQSTYQDVSSHQENKIIENKQTTNQSLNNPQSMTGNEQSQVSNRRKKKLSFGKAISLILILASVFFIGAGAFFGYNILSTADRVIVQGEDDCKGIFNFNCLDLGGVFWGDQRTKLKGEDEGRTNLLVVGTDSIAGLSDTIILISYFYEEQKVVTLNIPRDTYVTAEYANAKGQNISISEKINAVYPFAQKANPDNEGAGAEALANLITKEFEVPIHYWVVTNFEAVEQVVNELGGVTVNVDKAFTDCQFPRKNYSGYIRPCPSFEAGPQKMDGETALIYARSRNAEADGGDFARSRRQSIVIESIALEAQNKGIFGNINNIGSYLKIFGDNIKTNVQLDEMVSFYKLTEDINVEESFLRAVWQTDNGFLCDGPASAGRGYHIVYCGGQIIGSNRDSDSKKKARNFVQNLLIESQSELIYGAQVGMVGNLSDETTKARTEFTNLGFDNITFNNNYSSQIKAATTTSIENITIYIPDEELRDLFSKLNPGPDIQYSLVAEIPDEKKLPENMSSADIIVWVESI